MKNTMQSASMLLILFAVACKSKPSEKDIKRKILIEYICAETANVNGLRITDTKDAVAIFGNKGYEYTVSGEVEWVNGCREFGSGLPPGHREKFENKRVFLIKGDDGEWH